MGTYIVQVAKAQPGSPVSVGERIGEFETEEEARYFVSIAGYARRLRGCKLSIREAGAPAAPGWLGSAA